MQLLWLISQTFTDNVQYYQIILIEMEILTSRFHLFFVFILWVNLICWLLQIDRLKLMLLSVELYVIYEFYTATRGVKRIYVDKKHVYTQV